MMAHKDETVTANVNGVAFLFKQEQDHLLPGHRLDPAGRARCW